MTLQLAFRIFGICHPCTGLLISSNLPFTCFPRIDFTILPRWVCLFYFALTEVERTFLPSALLRLHVILETLREWGYKSETPAKCRANAEVSILFPKGVTISVRLPSTRPDCVAKIRGKFNPCKYVLRLLTIVILKI